ncbi:MAG: hypothetical protein ACJ8F7_04000, partial [Gemmataceae bacterium]
MFPPKMVAAAATGRYSDTKIGLPPPDYTRVEDAMPLEIARTAADVRDHLTRRLRGASADDVVRDHVRVVLGQQPYKHNHFAAAEFFNFDPGRGAVENVYGQRLLRTTGNFARGLTGVLEREHGADATGELLYRAGFAWGAADMQAFTDRVQQEYEVEFEKIGMGQMLESWWWPLRATGWGVWRYDFRHARNGLVLVDLDESLFANARSDADRPICHLYAGLFA